MAVQTADRYQIEREAADKASLQGALLNLSGDIGELRRQFDRVIPALRTISVAALVLSAATFILVIVLLVKL
jgi:hypothetical protein